MQQNLNFGFCSSLSSITVSVVGEFTELISSSGEGFELIEILMSIGTDCRIDAEILQDNLWVIFNCPL